MDVPFMIEHPECPRPPDMASSWKLKETTIMLQLGHVHSTTFDQCTLGAASPKPTTIMHRHVPQIHTVLTAFGHNGRCPHPSGTHTRRYGTELDSSWRSAPANTYPRPLCRALGVTFAHQIAHLWPTLTDTDDVDFEAYANMYQTLDHYANGNEDCWGADTFHSRWVFLSGLLWDFGDLMHEFVVSLPEAVKVTPAWGSR